MFFGVTEEGDETYVMLILSSLSFEVLSITCGPLEDGSGISGTRAGNTVMAETGSKRDNR